MRIAVRTVLLLVALALRRLRPAGPALRRRAAGLPPIPPGEARIFFYRWLEPYECTAATAVLSQRQ